MVGESNCGRCHSGWFDRHHRPDIAWRRPDLRRHLGLGHRGRLRRSVGGVWGGHDFLIVSGIIKYTWPGKNLKVAQVPNRSLLWGGVLAIAGFFLIPLVGIFAGFVAGVYLSERQRLGSHEKAWPSTVHALKAVGLSIIIELLGGLIASGIWVVAIFAV